MKFAALQSAAVFPLFNKLFNADLPVKAAYRLSKIQRVIAEEAEKYQEMRMDLIKKHAECDENGEMIVDDAGNVKLKDDSKEAFVAQMDELHDIEVELPGKIKLDDLETISLTVYEISLLEDLEILEE